MANILWAEADSPQELNTSWFRVRMPAQILGERGHKNVVTYILNLLHPSPELQNIIDSSDVIVLERLLVDSFHPLIKEWRKQGKRVISTFDDAYHLLPDSGGTPKQTWRGGKDAVVGTNADGSKKMGAILNQFRESLRLADTALVPSKILADDYRQFCPTIKFVPNVLHPDLYKDLKPRPPDNQFVVLWGGSSAHNISFRDSGIVPALGSICRKYSRVHVHLQTLDPSILSLMDKFNVRYDADSWVRFDDWPKIVKTADLYIAPLAGRYDDRRSSLKKVEAGMAGIPFVATDAPPYQNCGVGSVLVENKPKAWVDAISRLIESREERERLAQEGHTWAMGLYTGASEMYERALRIGNGKTA